MQLGHFARRQFKRIRRAKVTNSICAQQNNKRSRNGGKIGKIICNKLQIKSKRNIKHPPCCLDSNDSKYLQICQLKMQKKAEKKLLLNSNQQGI